MRLLVVDDHPEVRRCLRQMLELATSFDVVGDAGNGAEALERVDEAHPDIVIMDAKMPVMDGAQATEAIKQRHPEVHVIALSSTGELRRIAPMLEAGASGYVLKGEPAERFVTTVERSVRLLSGFRAAKKR